MQLQCQWWPPRQGLRIEAEAEHLCHGPGIQLIGMILAHGSVEVPAVAHNGHKMAANATGIPQHDLLLCRI